MVCALLLIELKFLSLSSNKTILNIFITEFQSMDKRIVNSKRRIPSAMHIAKIKNLNHTLLPTLTIDVRKTGNYDRIIGVQHYELIFEGVGGMNAPKKIVCVGTDGIPRTQLIKVPRSLTL